MLARVRAVTLTNYCEIARCLEIDPYAILSKAGLRPSALNDAENWLPGKQVLNVLDETARRSERDDFGVLLGEARTFASLGPVSLLLKHEATLGSVISSLIEYRRLVNELLHFRLRIDGVSALLEWSLIPGLRSSQGINLLATITYRVLVDGTAVNWQPECVHFRHTAPRHVAAFRRLFRCPIYFDSGCDGMSFHSRFLESPNAFADAGLTTHAHRLLNLLPGIRHIETTAERARATLPFLFHGVEADATNVARCLGLTVRTLQRRLAAEGHTLSELTNEVRRELAVRHLGSSNQRLINVACLAGYSTVSSFSRWFISEFGMPPGQWRRLTLNRRAADRFDDQRDVTCDFRGLSARARLAVRPASQKEGQAEGTAGYEHEETRGLSDLHAADDDGEPDHQTI